MEYARNVIGMEDADHAESNPKADSPLISKLSCTLSGKSERIKIQAHTLASQVYGKQETIERYSCNYSLNPEYQEQIGQGGLKFVGRNEAGAVRVIELEGHRFFIASLFLPQLNPPAGNPHPLIVDFLKAALRTAENRGQKQGR